MTDAYANESLVDDLDDSTDSMSARLSGQADAILQERSANRPDTLRKALRDDLSHGRDWANERALRARSVIQEEPIRTAAYAVGVGILIGLLLRR
ncbi:glycine zipper domain-containing protein [Brevundimonas variabilis]|uniref:ElaB/YqjD/DUF883 family membrane-anchored ribosome-binding protein n=1 Tax=Brevundimonas variabilis TaxID=74312 RepID=A0A7W9CI13_9CAUL|nr:DUF883 family protein [Brevundimonas variabilis]MBB5746040.1 ElaB/YqjD/DUF883 family membrane-anchored ribosome-binding protein [Brevundimonas variabilis]